MSCRFVDSFYFSRKKCTSASARVQFFQQKLNESTDQQDMFRFNHASAFCTSNSIVKMLTNNKFEAQTLTGNHAGISRCHVLASRALNMPCSFGQSARPPESMRLCYIKSANYLDEFQAKIRQWSVPRCICGSCASCSINDLWFITVSCTHTVDRWQFAIWVTVNSLI